MPQTLFTGRVFSVERRALELPGGGSAQRDVVVHPGAVVILPLVDDDHVVMIRNRRDAVRERLLELPAGTRKADESPETTAVRELAEETGYRASTLTVLATFYTTPGFSDEFMHAFEARGLTPDEQELDSGEDIEVEVMLAARLIDMLRGGELRDGKTIATLATYFLRRG